MLSGNSVTIGCKKLENFRIGMNRSYGDYSNVKLFGCDSYVFISSLSSTQIKQIDLWYGDDVKVYKMWDPTAHIIIIKRDVMFDEYPLIKSDTVKYER